MARVCDYCGKRTESGAQLARRGLPKKQGGIGLRVTGHTKRKFKPNIQRIAAVVDGVTTRVKVCTRCIKSGRVKKPATRKATKVA
ncbi:MAG: 50S ribosomal protein L28 [Planctomycetota bacterium]|nr:50S ribosomal protein L28 [Planctomycetota bacterium]